MLHRIQQAPGGAAQPQLLRHENGTFLLQSTPWGSDLGLDWVLLTASSANAEVTQARITLAIEIGAAVLALGFTLPQPDQQDSSAVERPAAGQSDHRKANQPAGGCPASGLGIPL